MSTKTGFVIGDRPLGAAGDTHPAWMMGYARTGSYTVVGTSAIGQLHLAQQRPRDDAFVVRSIGPWVAACVSDGLGSRPLSRYGSTFTVELLTGALLRPFASFDTADKNQPAATTSPDDATIAPPTTTVDEDPLPPPVQQQGLLDKGKSLLVSLLASSVTSKHDDDQDAQPKGELTPEELRQLLTTIEGIRSEVEGAIEKGVAKKSLTEDVRVAIEQLTQLSGSTEQTSNAENRVHVIGSLGWRLTEQEPTEEQQPHGGNVPPAPPDKPDLEKIMQGAFQRTHDQLKGYAKNIGRTSPDELGCTALAILLNVETQQCVVGQVGDGAILGLYKDGDVRELLKSDDTEDLQATYTINRPSFEKHLTIQTVSGNIPKTFFLMTDGISNDYLYSPDHEALKRWAALVKDRVQHMPSLARATASLLDWLATYKVQGSWDDRTLVVITATEGTDGNH